MLEHQIWNCWVGENYATQRNRLLLIGESHYAQNEDGSPNKEYYEGFKNNPNFTIEFIIDELIDRRKSWNFFDNTYRLLFGDTNINIKDFWSKVSFYNLIQKPIETIGTRPTNDDFRKYIKLSLEIINEMKNKPNYVIYLGNSGRHYFEKSVNNNKNFKIKEVYEERIGIYYGVKYQMELPNKLNIFFIKHPSQYFSWEKWREFILDENLKKYLDENFN